MHAKSFEESKEFKNKRDNQETSTLSQNSYLELKADFTRESISRKLKAAQNKNSELNPSLFQKVTHTDETFQLDENNSQDLSKLAFQSFRQPLTAKNASKKPFEFSITPKKQPPKVSVPSSPSAEEKFRSLELPLSAATASRHFKYLLTSYEQGEILDYTEIYFLGLNAKKVRSYSSLNNHGFDDDKGDYKIVHKDHFAYRYEVLEILGKGSFGQVIKVLDHKLNQEFALKVIKNRPRFHQAGTTEVKILKLIQNKDKRNKYNLVHMKDCFIFRKHLCIVFELLSIDLFEFIKLNNFRGLSFTLIKRFASQILVSLHVLHSLKIIHCDLKPENILLRSANKSSIKVIDMGSACFSRDKPFNYIQSRFYRAPEIILGSPYSTKIDIWSLGCILAELYTGHPLFPGENETDQLMCMIEVLGPPPEAIVESSSRKYMFFDSKGEPRMIPNSRGKKRLPRARPLNYVLRGANLLFVDLVEKCLNWDPQQRMTPKETLSHAWFQQAKNSDSINFKSSHIKKYSGDTTPTQQPTYNPLFPKNIPHSTKFVEKSFVF